jgi:hypothetical protein
MFRHIIRSLVLFLVVSLLVVGAPSSAGTASWATVQHPAVAEPSPLVTAGSAPPEPRSAASEAATAAWPALKVFLPLVLSGSFGVGLTAGGVALFARRARRRRKQADQWSEVRRRLLELETK